MKKLLQYGKICFTFVWITNLCKIGICQIKFTEYYVKVQLFDICFSHNSIYRLMDNSHKVYCIVQRWHLATGKHNHDQEIMESLLSIFFLYHYFKVRAHHSLLKEHLLLKVDVGIRREKQAHNIYPYSCWKKLAINLYFNLQCIWLLFGHINIRDRIRTQLGVTTGLYTDQNCKVFLCPRLGKYHMMLI